MSRITTRTLATLAALLIAGAAPAVAQSNDGDRSDPPTETRTPQNPERPSLRRRPPPSDNPRPRQDPPRERERDRGRDNQSRSSVWPAADSPRLHFLGD